MTYKTLETESPLTTQVTPPTPPEPAWLREAREDWQRAVEAVSIDPQAGSIPSSLNAELFAFPEAMARWGFRLSEATREFNLATLRAEDCWAAALENAKGVLGPTTRGKVSQADYERFARQNNEWRSAELARIHAEAKTGRLKSVMNGLAAKREALMSLGANLRAELLADPSLRDK